VKLFISGDIINKHSREQFVDVSLSEKIKESDYAICNLEGVFIPKNNKRFSYVFQQRETLGFLKEAGFKMMLMSNNHTADFGKEGLLETMEEIQKLSLDFMGAGFSIDEVYQARILEIKGLKIGLINLCEAQVGQFVTDQQEYGYAWIGHHLVDKLIVDTKAQVDHLLVLVHAGLEHYGLPLMEYRRLFRHYCDLGADAVVASHSHFTQGIEKYRDSLIFYSLGNFFFPYTSDSDSTNIENQSFSVVLDLDGKNMDYSLVYHSVDRLKVRLTSAEQSLIHVEELNAGLAEPLYSKLIHEIYLKAYYGLCHPLYKQSLMATDTYDNLSETVKFLVKYLFFRKKYWLKTQAKRDQTLLRLIENETYRYVVQYVLSLKQKDYEDRY